MNCDEAFDLMTSPEAQDSPALAAHLAQCRRCCDMRSALSPALEAFTEARERPIAETISPLFVRPLLSSEAVAVAERVSLRLTKSRRHRQTTYLSWASSVAVAGFLGAILGAFTVREARPNPVSAVVSPEPTLLTACLWTEDRTRNNRLRSGQTPGSVVASCVLCHVPTELQ